ncbi:WapI family immunity protein [Micromonosporaceae bacterium Da 78-11]
MRLIDADGYGVHLRVTGYQFPDAEDPGLRYSWHMVQGSAVRPAASWSFRHPALTCADSQYLGDWLRAAAHRLPAAAHRLTFTEPNLTFAVAEHSPGLVTLDIGLGQEFASPADGPCTVRVTLTDAQVAHAAAEWADEIAPYPAHPITGPPN